MKRLSISLAVAALAALVAVATAFAADPTPAPSGDQVRARDTIPAVLGLSWEEVRDLRQDGLTLAEIAERQKVEPQALIDALVLRWTERIEARVANGALTAAEGATLRTQLETRAKAMVYQVPLGGLHGAAVGAGPGSGNGQGAGNGQGVGNGAARGNGQGYGMGGGRGMNAGSRGCDGTGPNGQRGD
jgi:hypothetical protein